MNRLLRAPPGSKIYFFSRALNLTEIFTEYLGLTKSSQIIKKKYKDKEKVRVLFH